MFRAIESRSINYDHVMYLLAFVLAESCGPASVGFAGISRCTSPRLLDYDSENLWGRSGATRPDQSMQNARAGSENLHHRAPENIVDCAICFHGLVLFIFRA